MVRILLLVLIGLFSFSIVFGGGWFFFFRTPGTDINNELQMGDMEEAPAEGMEDASGDDVLEPPGPPPE